MSLEIRLAKVFAAMEEGTLLKWRVAVGDMVQSGDVLAEVAVDMDSIDIEAPADGQIVSLAVDEGATVAVGALLAQLASSAAPGEAPDSAVQASPAARKLARDLAIDLHSVHGSGPGGRIVLADVERARPHRQTPAGEAAAGKAPQTEEKQDDLFSAASGKSVKIRRLLARKMEESWKTIPHFYVTMTVDMTDVIRFRKDLNFTINDFILAATSHALQEQPWINSHWNGERGIEQEHVDLAMAVESERGLFYPVIRNCEKLTLRQISQQAAAMAEKAHQGALSKEETEGGSFTITNMGMLGVESFGALITPPQAAVLAVGTVKGEIVVDDQGEPAVAPIMRLTLSADHRILDGADAAGFLGTVKSYLEAPIVLVAE
ncbi:MAG: dihydrolipoamide acetyltransferase family protein [Desulfuromonadales bacterium]|nr:dihydrolipoamide acetyltransferase family protein [Desulfuromonadales bacterium]